MKKLAILAVAALMLGLVISGCARARQNIPTYTDPAQAITVSAGQQFVIYLPYDPDTGFTWYEEYDSSKVELVQSICVVCQVGDIEFLAGQGYDVTAFNSLPATAQFSQFKALSRGETKITMAYKTSAAAEPVETQTFTIAIQ